MWKIPSEERQILAHDKARVKNKPKAKTTNIN